MNGPIFDSSTTLNNGHGHGHDHDHDHVHVHVHVRHRQLHRQRQRHRQLQERQLAPITPRRTEILIFVFIFLGLYILSCCRSVRQQPQPHGPRGPIRPSGSGAGSRGGHIDEQIASDLERFRRRSEVGSGGNGSGTATTATERRNNDNDDDDDEHVLRLTIVHSRLKYETVVDGEDSVKVKPPISLPLSLSQDDHRQLVEPTTPSNSNAFINDSGTNSDCDDHQYQHVCSICLDGYQPGEVIAKPTAKDCQHRFHRDCIVAWLQKHDVCPLCRVDLIQPDPD